MTTAPTTHASAPAAPAVALASLTLICPTIGRSSLATLRDQALAQLAPADQFIVVGDGPRPRARSLMTEPADPRLVYLETEPTGNYGSEQIDHAIDTAARGDYLMFIGDDDELAPDALALVRRTVSVADPHPYLFAMRYHGELMHGRFAFGLCSGQQFVVPNDRARLARYAAPAAASYENNDWLFMNATARLWAYRIELRPEVISVLHYRNQGRIW